MNLVTKLNTKMVQEIGKIGHVFKLPEGTFYILPAMIVKHKSMPVGVYNVIKMEDLPAEVLAIFGLQKISAKLPQYRAFKSGDLIEAGDRYLGEDGVSLKEFNQNVIGESVDEALIGNTRFLKLVKTESDGTEL